MSGKYRLLLAFWGDLFVVSALILIVNIQVVSVKAAV